MLGPHSSSQSAGLYNWPESMGDLDPSSRTTSPNLFGLNSFLHASSTSIPGAGVLSRTLGTFCHKGSWNKSKSHPELFCDTLVPPPQLSSARERAQHWHVHVRNLQPAQGQEIFKLMKLLISVSTSGSEPDAPQNGFPETEIDCLPTSWDGGGTQSTDSCRQTRGSGAPDFPSQTEGRPCKSCLLCKRVSAGGRWGPAGTAPRSPCGLGPALPCRELVLGHGRPAGPWENLEKTGINKRPSYGAAGVSFCVNCNPEQAVGLRGWHSCPCAIWTRGSDAMKHTLRGELGRNPRPERTADERHPGGGPGEDSGGLTYPIVATCVPPGPEPARPQEKQMGDMEGVSPMSPKRGQEKS